MNKLLTIIALCLSALTVAASQYDSYYDGLPISLQKVSAPTINTQRMNITDNGAKGDGQTDCTAAIQGTIDRLAATGGGHVDVPAGIWLTAPLTLKTGIDLHLQAGAILQLTENRTAHIKQGERRALPGISADEAHDIAITGKGIIDGNGEFWRAVKKSKQSDVEWKDYLSMGGTLNDGNNIWYPYNLKHQSNFAASMEQQERMRNNLIRFDDCERVLVEGVTIQNSPKFHLTTNDCTDVTIDGVMVRCPWNAQNGDAIDIGTSQRVLIVNNTIDCGDDGICMKGATGDQALSHKPCRDILVRHNTVFHAHGGFVIGSEFSAGMYDIVVCDNVFSGTDTGLRFKSAVGRGGKTGNIHCYNIYMTDIREEAIIFETSYADRAVSGTTGPAEGAKWVPEWTDIHISNVTVGSTKTAIKAKGAPGMVHDIDISNSIFFYTSRATDIDDACDVKLSDVKLVTYDK